MTITLYVYDLIDVADDHVMQLVVPTGDSVAGSTTSESASRSASSSASRVTILRAAVDASIRQLKQRYFDLMGQHIRRVGRKEGEGEQDEQQPDKQRQAAQSDDDLDGPHRRTSMYAPRHMRWVYLTNLARPLNAPRLLGDLDDAKTLEELGVCDQSWICTKSRWIAARADSEADTAMHQVDCDPLASEMEELIEWTRCMNKTTSSRADEAAAAADDDDDGDDDAHNDDAHNDSHNDDSHNDDSHNDDSHSDEPDVLLDDDGNRLSEEHDWYYLEMRRRGKEREEGERERASAATSDEAVADSMDPNHPMLLPTHAQATATSQDMPQWQL